MVYYINSTEMPRQMNADANLGFRLRSSKKADLLVEGVRFAQENGLSEVYIDNFKAIKEEKWFDNGAEGLSKVCWKEKVTVLYCKEAQGWHIFKQDEEWYFNMNNATKTVHKIEIKEE